jgi:hypothetical protein
MSTAAGTEEAARKGSAKSYMKKREQDETKPLSLTLSLSAKKRNEHQCRQKLLFL